MVVLFYLLVLVSGMCLKHGCFVLSWLVIVVVFSFSCRSALTLASPEIRFHIDSETHDPIDVQAKEIR